MFFLLILINPGNKIREIVAAFSDIFMEVYLPFVFVLFKVIFP